MKFEELKSNPIEATPILTGKDVELILEQICQPITEEAKQKNEACYQLYLKYRPKEQA